MSEHWYFLLYVVIAMFELDSCITSMSSIKVILFIYWFCLFIAGFVGYVATCQLLFRVLYWRTAITVCMSLLTRAEIFVVVWICRQFIGGKDWNGQWGCLGVSSINITEHQPSTYFDMKVWSRMFAVNVQSVAIQQVNWFVISWYNSTWNHSAVVY